MFVFNLQPLPVRGNGYLYSWMVNPATSNFSKEEICFFGAPWQLKSPDQIKYEQWVYDLSGPPSVDAFNRAKLIEVPHSLIKEVRDSFSSEYELSYAVSVNGIQAYRQFAFEKLSEIHKKYGIQAIINFGADQSMRDVARYLNVPFILNEGGHLREPAFKVSTFLFDFEGFGSQNEALQRYSSFRCQTASRTTITRERLLETFGTQATMQAYVMRSEPAFEFGAALQVEDDLNMISYSNNINTLQLLYRLRQIYPQDQILARDHPLSYFKLRGDNNLCRVDSSVNSIDFLTKIRRFACVNSSVGLESLLFGLPTFVLGRSPLNFMAHEKLDRHVWEALHIDPDLDKKLEFYLINYLMPKNGWMNPEYYSWRCSFPDEEAIRSKHLELYSEYVDCTRLT